MKKILTIFTIFMLMIPFYVNGENYTSYKNDIKNELNFDVGRLKIESLAFVDNSDTDLHSFGLYGDIDNESDNEEKITVVVDYLTKNDKTVASLKRSWTIPKGKGQKFNLLHNLNEIKGKYEVGDIKFFTLKIDIASDSLDDEKPSSNSFYKRYDYVVDSYDIVVDMYENNTYDVTEKIVFFNNIGDIRLTRDISFKNKIETSDGSLWTKRLSIDGSDIEKKYDTIKENSLYRIILDENSKKGTNEYQLKYKVNLGENAKRQFLYIIDSNWNNPVGGIKFRINFPKPIDREDVNITVGRENRVDEKLKYELIGNSIVGSYKGILDSKESIVIEMDFEDEYYADINRDNQISLFIMYLIPLLCMLISFGMWFFCGKDDETEDKLNPYPPKMLNSLELGYDYKGYADGEDVASLLLYLAVKGYLKIEEAKDKYKIVKLKDYDGKNRFEKEFLNNLFHDNKTEVLEEACIESKRFNSATLRKVNSKKNRNKIFYEGETFRKVIVALLMFISVMIIFAIPLYDFGALNWILPTIGIIFIYIPAMYLTISDDTPSLVKVIFGVVVCIQISTFVIFNDVIFDSITIDSGYTKPFIFGLLNIVVMGICLKEMPKRTKYGNQIYSSIKGFKKYIDSINISEIENLVTNNSSYYYDILPYIYSLGMTKKWSQKFKEKVKESPDWFEGDKEFILSKFIKIIDDIMDDIKP